MLGKSMMLRDRLVATGGESRRRVARDGLDYRLIHGCCLIAFLVAGAIERLNPLYWSEQPVGRPRVGLWIQAKEAAGRCASMAFQG
jgi:hypothetical protein